MDLNVYLVLVEPPVNAIQTARVNVMLAGQTIQPLARHVKKATTKQVITTVLDALKDVTVVQT